MTMMENKELAKIYRNYIECLNNHAIDDLSTFVLDELFYNDKKISRREYEMMLMNDIETFPDLKFNIDVLVVNENYVASRILFNCTPVKDFHNFKSNGNPISFSENVFYKFENSRISQVWSLLDLEKIGLQLDHK